MPKAIVKIKPPNACIVYTCVLFFRDCHLSAVPITAAMKAIVRLIAWSHSLFFFETDGKKRKTRHPNPAKVEKMTMTK